MYLNRVRQKPLYALKHRSKSLLSAAQARNIGPIHHGRGIHEVAELVIQFLFQRELGDRSRITN